METLREIRRRIRSVHNLSQVTRALEAVSASKVQKAQVAVMRTRAYAHRAWEVIVNLSSVSGTPLHPLLIHREPVRAVAILLFASDRGLCGAYNQNVVRAATEFAAQLSVPTRYIVVGRRGRDILWRARADILATFPGLPAVPSLADVSAIARTAIEEFLEGRADEVFLAHTEFVNLLQQRPVIRRLAESALLPLLNGFGVSIDGVTVHLSRPRRRALARRLALRLERVLLNRIGILVRHNRLISRPALRRLVRITLMGMRPFHLTVRIAGLSLRVRVTIAGHP